jgi:NifU-like protein involved in Fe-S cluster formation
MAPGERLFDAHFRSPRGAGRLPEPAPSGRAANAACGDELELWLAVEGGVVRDARFEARGCSAVIATASLVCSSIAGQDLGALAELDVAALAAAAGATRRELAHAPSVVARALGEVLAAHRSRCQA